MKLKKLTEELTALMEDNKEVIGTIIKDSEGFNIESNGEKLLVRGYSSLKSMLQDLAKNM